MHFDLQFFFSLSLQHLLRRPAFGNGLIRLLLKLVYLKPDSAYFGFGTLLRRLFHLTLLCNQQLQFTLSLCLAIRRCAGSLFGLQTLRQFFLSQALGSPLRLAFFFQAHGDQQFRTQFLRQLLLDFQLALSYFRQPHLILAFSLKLGNQLHFCPRTRFCYGTTMRFGTSTRLRGKSGFHLGFKMGARFLYRLRFGDKFFAIITNQTNFWGSRHGVAL